MTVKYLCVAICVSLLSFTIAFGQSRDTAVVGAVFKSLLENRKVQSSVLLTNRDIYLAGENIWFRAYAVHTSNGSVDLTPRNLFADIVTDKDSVIDQLVLDNADLRTNGAFHLPLTLPTGIYWVRCYTAAQLKDSRGMFVRPVYILNKRLHDEHAFETQLARSLGSKRKAEPSVRFYAERLTELPGVISTGVVEISDAYGDPLYVNGELVNNKDTVIARFETNRMGLARLTFVVDSGQRYTAIFHVGNQTVRYELPRVNNDAIQLSAGRQTAKTIKAFVTLEQGVPVDTRTTVLAVQKDHLYFASVGKGSYGITIPLDKLEGGTAELLLFDGNNRLVSERRIYIAKDNAVVDIQPDKKRYGTREKVNVRIKVSAAHGKPLASALAVAVEDEWIRQLSDSLEAADLPPSDVFLLNNWLARHRDKYTADDIDLLLATRSSVQELYDTAYSPTELAAYDDPRQLLYLSGQIRDRKARGVGGRIVTAISKDTSHYFMDVDTTDKYGRFQVQMPQGMEDMKLSLQVTDQHKVQMPDDSITLERFHFPEISTPPALKEQFLASSMHMLSVLKRYRADAGITFQDKDFLPAITVKTIIKPQVDYDESKRINLASKILTSDKFRYGGADAIGNAMLMVPGVTLAGGDISIFGLSIDLRGNIGHPYVIMDGVPAPVSAFGGILPFLNSLSPADIDFIEVLRGAEAASFGILGGNGVISINTRHGSPRIDYSKSNFRAFRPVTYHTSPKFEMPDYSNIAIKDEHTPDPRTTIFWDGSLMTGAKGEASVNFYTADHASNYVITVSGLTANGELIEQRTTIDNSGRSR